MLQFKIQGRGGQGAQSAGTLLAEAFFREGKYIQAYATYGGARRGTPVSAFVRVDNEPIRLRCDIETPDAIICFDQGLVNEALLKGATEKTIVLINSADPPGIFKEYGDFKITTLDAILVAQASQLGRIVNTTLVGAFAGLLGEPDIDVLLDVIREKSPAKTEQNVKACLEGYGLVTKGGNN